MIAIDTNILARWILRDDEAQLRIAQRILSGPCWISWTVLLELVWLLGSYGQVERRDIAAILDTLMEMPTLYFDRPGNLQWAVDRYRQGADIADMFHIASSADVTAFVSFEKSLSRKAGPKAPIAVQSAE